MKRLLVFIITVMLIFVFCSCTQKDKDTSKGNSSDKIVNNSETSDDSSETDDTTASTESSGETSGDADSPPETPPDTPENSNVTSSSQVETPQEENPVPINFVPNQIPALGNTPAFIPYHNETFYKGVKYAGAAGKNNGADCYAIVTAGNNDEYLNCIYVFDAANNEQSVFGIYNDRIYFLQYESNDPRDSKQLNSFSVCSVNLSGRDKRVEKNISLPFTHINCTSYYLNSKYLFFTVDNPYNGVSGRIYRYNTQTKELTDLGQQLGSHKSLFSIEERVFVYSSDEQAVYEYDINFNNQKLFFDVRNYYFSKFAAQGLVFSEQSTGSKYLLDFSGNLSKQ